MLKIYSKSEKIIITPNEERIFSVIRNACLAVPAISKQKYTVPVARVCGGWIRDKLLGIKSNDIDIALDIMTGAEFAEYLVKYSQIIGVENDVKFAAKMSAKPEQSKHLEVAIVKAFGQKIDFMNLRKEEYLPGNRIPKMVFGTADEDALRRDLTINSIFYRINDGEIEDYSGMGKKDLFSNPIVLRTPLDPKTTFLQDPLRVLRVLRFHCRYNSIISEETLKGMENEEVQNLITRRLYDRTQTTGITAERVADEFRQIMKSANPEKALKIMFSIGLGQKIFSLPENYDPEGWNMDQRNIHHEQTILQHVLTAVESVNNIGKGKGYSANTRMLLNIAALFHDIGKIYPKYQQQKNESERSYHGHELGSADISRAFCKALKLNNNETKTISDLTKFHMKGHGIIEQQDLTSLRRFKRKLTDKVDYSEIEKYINDPDITAEEKQNLLDELQSLKEQENMWDLVLSLGAADASAKTKEIDQNKYNEYFEKQKQLREIATAPPTIKENALLNGNEIMEIFAPLGLKPSSGYIEAIKEDIRSAQDENPNLTKEDAINILLRNKNKYLDMYS
jgi:tRNA nucleotidyltransferase/poly(A) polymerase